ncbi:hypothetical protein AgCh_025044 [Apium graveolens]
MPRRPVRHTRVPAPSGPGSSDVVVSNHEENPSDSDISDSERTLDVAAEETPMPPPSVPSFVLRDIPGPGSRPCWVHRDQSPGLAAQFNQIPIAPFQGISSPSPEVRARVRALTQMAVERARSVDHFISSEFRVVQYQDLVNWLVFELGSIGGSGSVGGAAMTTNFGVYSDGFFSVGFSVAVKPPEFKGEVDPIAARIWLKEIEKTFALTKVSEDLKTDYASYFLKNDSNYWWESMRALEGEVQAALVIESDQRLATNEQGEKKRKFESGPARSESGIASRKFQRWFGKSKNKRFKRQNFPQVRPSTTSVNSAPTRKGHYSTECKSEIQGVTCFSCGKVGHIARNCKSVIQDNIGRNVSQGPATSTARARTFKMTKKSPVHDSDVATDLEEPLTIEVADKDKKELNIRQRRRLELIKNIDWEILYHSGKANVVADALSKKEKLKMIMSLGEFMRDFEKMEIEVKVTGAGTEKMFEIAIQSELSKKNILCQKKNDE